MSSQPKVSVLVPVMNVEEYLKNALDSLQKQTLREIEVLLLDDGSTDGSLSILQEYAEADSRFRVVEKENTGYGHTLNVGLDQARGEYIGILEPDDCAEPGMYARLYEEADRYNLDFVKSDFTQFRTEPDGTLREGPVWLSPSDMFYNRTLEPGKEKETFFFPINTWTGIYRRSFLNDHGIRHHESPGASFQDNGFYFQTFCLGKRVRFLRDRLYRYRVDNPHSSSVSREKEHCVTDEFHWIHDWLAKDPERLAEFESVMYDKQYYSMMLTAGRLAEDRKLAFLLHMRGELERPYREGLFDRRFLTKEDWKYLDRLMTDPEGACWALMEREAAERKWEEETQKTTGLPKRIRSGIHLLRKQGVGEAWRYTIGLFRKD